MNTLHTNQHDEVFHVGQLQADEIVTLVFEASDWFYVRAWQAGVIETQLDKYPADFHVKSIDYWRPGLLVFKIRILRDATKLWTQAEIARLISEGNPRGLKLAFLESWRDFKEEIGVPVARFTMGLALVVVIGLGFYALAVHGKNSAAST